MGWRGKKGKSGCNYSIVFLDTVNILSNIFEKSVQINIFVKDKKNMIIISGRGTEVKCISVREKMKNGTEI